MDIEIIIGGEMLAGMNFLQSYVLTEHLHIPENQQGGVTGNLAFKGVFVSLWAIQVAPMVGRSTSEALAGAGRLMGIMGAVILLWTPLFGLILDRVNRVTGMALAMGLAGLGYCSIRSGPPHPS